MSGTASTDIDAVLARMRILGEAVAGDSRRFFHDTYRRTTAAVDKALRDGAFLDGPWVERWDAVFADLYLDALEADLSGRPAPTPWAVVFASARDRPDAPPLQRVLFGMNAHINDDLPQALALAISPEEFDDPTVLARREADHRRIDDVLSSRVAAEALELAKFQRPTRIDRMLAPFNRAGTRRFLVEARRKVWRNARLLDEARRRNSGDYSERLAQLEKLAGDRVADLTRPGPVLLRLAVRGFGVELAAGASRPPAVQTPH